VVVPEPYPDIRVDCDSFLDRAFPDPDKAPGQNLRDRYREILQRAVIHMYHDPMDYMVWSLNLLSSRQRELALAAGDACLKLSPNYAIGHLVRGLALEDMGRGDQARAEIDKAFAGNPFLSRVFAPFTSVFLNGGTREEFRAEVQKLEDMGLVWFSPALWTLYRNRFEPQSELLPVGLTAPRDEYYRAWMTYFGKSPRQIVPLNARATAQLDLVSALMRPQNGP
jgi:tetratricopeptide (TPR) repeat protein